MTEPGRCANCDLTRVGPEQKFCPACGQPTPARRIDWKFLGNEFEHSVLHMDRGILYSLKNLMLRPGHLMRDYIEGRRANQVKPLPLLLIMAAVVVFLTTYLLGIDVMDSAMQAGNSDPPRAQADARLDMAPLMKSFAAMNGWMNRNFAATTLLLLPLEAAAFRLAFHRVGNLNYPEWLVITTFLTVQTFVLWALSVLLQRWLPQLHGTVLFLSIAYGLFSLAQLFHGYPRWKSVLRGLLGFGIFMLISTALTMLLVVVLFIVSK